MIICRGRRRRICSRWLRAGSEGGAGADGTDASLLPQANNTPTRNLSSLRLSGPDGTTDLTASDAQILHALTRAPGRRLEGWQNTKIISLDADAAAESAMGMRVKRLRKKRTAVGAPVPAIKAMHKLGNVLCCTVAQHRTASRADREP